MSVPITCPVCSSANVEIFFEMKDIPVHCNVLLATREEAVSAPRGDMKLGFCHECGHIYNYVFNPKLMMYTQAYENSLHFSPRFQRYAEELAKDLISRYDLHNKTIIEIGCGKGDFLKLMCDLGGNRGFGFDASYEPELMVYDLVEEKTSQERFTVIQDFYSEKYSLYNADFICCRHVLEHVEFPNDFLNNIRSAIGSRPHAVMYFEVPNALWTLRDLGVWDLIYEHCSYFTPDSLAYLFSTSGFEVIRLEEQFGRQFLGIEMKPKIHLVERDSRLAQRAERDRSPVQLAQSFEENYRAKVQGWKKHFEQFQREGKRVVVWGGGSKGIKFLNVLNQHADLPAGDTQAGVEYMVDINPRKQGMYVAGAGQKIVGPEFLRVYKPDVVIVMNPIYQEEIQRMLKAENLTPAFLTA